MYGAGAFQLGNGLVIDAPPFLLVFRRSVSLLVGVVGDVDGYEIGVEELDDLVLRERTALQIGGSASAAPDVEITHVREQEQGPTALLGQAFALAEAFHPADLVEAFLLPGRLDLRDALIDLVAVQAREGWLLGGECRHDYQTNATQQ